MWQCLAIVFLMVSLCQSINVDIYDPVIRTTIQTDFSADLVNKDLFGYRVALYNSSQGFSIIVGAPKGSHTSPPPNDGIHNLPYGVVYNCPVDPGVCVGLDGGGVAGQRLYDNRGNANDEQKNGQFMGGTVRVRDGGLLVCAPRYIRISGDRHPIGWCVYTYETDFSMFYPPPGVNEIRWCSLGSRIGTHLDLSVCGLGSGGDITGNQDFITQGGDDNGIAVGVPGNVNWLGGIREYTADTSIRGVSRTFVTGRNVENSTEDSHNALMGYDLVFFRRNGPPELPSVLASAPRFNQLRGLVTVYENFVPSGNPLPLQDIFGTQVGSAYGASLASVDFNGDNRDEVVVGAPTYSDPQRGLFEIGQIHIYLNNQNLTLLRTITGTQPYAQFGYAVYGLGDIDNNGLGDLAVGAPFGDGSGTVYIYSGVGGDEIVRLTQTIVGSELNVVGGLANLRSFGSSLSNSLDVDSNGYPDIAVGAYMSQQVFLLRTRPVANVTIRLIPPTIASINLDNTSSTPVQVCLTYSGQSLPDNLNINYRFILERENTENGLLSRAEFQNDDNEISDVLPLLANNEQCVPESTVTFSGDPDGDVYTPITVDFILSLADPVVAATDGNRALDAVDISTRPILRVIGDTRIQIPLLKGCGLDNVCMADLQLTVMDNNIEFERDSNIDGELDNVAAGVVTAVRIPVRLNNAATEPAVAPVVSLIVPNIVGFISVFQSGPGQLAYICSTRSNSSTTVEVECGIGVVLTANDDIDLIFRIQTRNIIGSEGSFTIYFNSTSSSEELDVTDNSDEAIVGVSAEADVFVRSSFRPDSVEIGGNAQTTSTGSVADLGPLVQGQFVVRNRGPSAIPSVQLTIMWPSHINDEDYLYPHSIVGDSDDVSCSQTNLNPRNLPLRRRRQSGTNTGGVSISCADNEPHMSCVAITCDISDLRANESSTIRIDGYVVSQTFAGTTTQHTFEASALATITGDSANFITQPDDHEPDMSTATLLGVPANIGGGSDDGVEAWVIIVPIIVAIIIIVVATILLYFFGFFKRKKVDKGDEVDLTNWRSAEDAGGAATSDNDATLPPERLPSEEPNTRRYSNTDI